MVLHLYFILPNETHVLFLRNVAKFKNEHAFDETFSFVKLSVVTFALEGDDTRKMTAELLLLPRVHGFLCIEQFCDIKLWRKMSFWLRWK